MIGFGIMLLRLFGEGMGEGGWIARGDCVRLCRDLTGMASQVYSVCYDANGL